MAVLKVVSLSENELILSTPSLKDITVANIISILVLSGIVILGGLFLKKTEYDSRVSGSYQGYLDELTCERQEKNLVHCKLDRTYANGQKVTLFSSPVKSATSSVVTTSSEDEDTYTCYVSFVKRNRQRIDNIDLFTTVESSKGCPATKQTVKQINKYILGKGNVPLRWQKDTRVGDLTKSYESLWQDRTAIGLVFFVSFILSFSRICGLVFDSEESWKFNSYSKKAEGKYRNRISKGEDQFSINRIEDLEYTYSTLTIKYKDKDRSKSINLIFSSKENRDKAKSFLENATGLTAKEIVSDD